MKIGYAQQIITPSLDRPVFLAGFGQNRLAQTVHDDLYARALALRDGTDTLVLCALDLIGFYRQDILEMARDVNRQGTGLQVIIASTHTHHGPDTLGLWGPDLRTCGVDPGYLSEVKRKTTGVILSAVQNLQPAQVKFTSVQVPGVAKNARDPAILDNELTLGQFTGPEDGPPLVTMFNFPCHPEVLSNQNTHITSDYPGVLRREVETATGAPCIFFAGALGGMMTPDVKDHSFEEAEAIGKKLASEGLKALEAVNAIQEAKINKQTGHIHVKLTNPLFRLAIWRKLLPELRDRHGVVTSEVSLLMIDRLWLAAVPGELLPRLGLELKSTMQAAGAQVAGILGLANDELGYILPEEEFRYPINPFRPGQHYEETMSISKKIGPAVMETSFALLKQQKGI